MSAVGPERRGTAPGADAAGTASEREAANPMVAAKVAKRWNQALGACLRPYKDLERRHT